VSTHSSPETVAQFARIPIKTVGSATVLLGDVAKVCRQLCRSNEVLCTSTASVRPNLAHSEALRRLDAGRGRSDARHSAVIKASAPQGMELKIDFDQSVFGAASRE